MAESRIARQERLERKALRIVGVVALSIIVANVAWAIANAFLPQGHIDCMESLAKLSYGMQRPEVEELLGSPDGRDCWMPSLCGQDGGPWMCDVYFDDSDRNLKLLVYCEDGYVTGAEVRDTEDNTISELKKP